ncbi:MAG: lysophospholipid acyltransferase family protein, partial [Smithellaceae bacterium]
MYLQKSISRITDFSLTLLLWSYYLLGSIVLFFFCYLPAYFFSANRAAAIQKYTHIQMKIFFKLTPWLIPRTRFTIQDEVRRLRSSVIVCNHLSYLDPILLISLLPQQRTIVKNTFFKIPFFGWFMRNAGYVPSAPSEMLGEAMVKNLESIKKHLEAGGNLFVFPEGTRSRDG